MKEHNENESCLSSSAKELESSFIERMKLCAERVGSVSALARAAGISQSGIRRYFSGGEPSRPQLIAIAKAADVTVAWLATGKEPSPIEDSGEDRSTTYMERSNANADEDPSVNEVGCGTGEPIFKAHMARKEKAEKEYWQQSLPASFYARLVPTLNMHSSDTKTIEKLLNRVISMVMILTVDLKTWPEHISDEHLEQLVAIAAAAIQRDDKARANDAWF